MWVHKDYPLFELIGMVIIVGLVGLYSYFTYYDDASFYSDKHISVWSELDFGLYSLARIILMYYFYKLFDKYPWSKWPAYFNNDPHYKSKMRSTSLRLIIWLVLYIAIMSGHLIYETSIDAPTAKFEGSSYLRIFLDSVLTSSYAVYIPMMVSQCALTYTLLKYELYLYNLQSTMGNNMDKESLNEVFTSYISMIESFKTQYGEIWQTILLCQLIAMFYVIWNAIEKLEQNYHNHELTHELSLNELRWLWISSITEIYHLIPFIEYVYSSSRLNKQYESFKNFYWGLVINTVKNSNDVVNYQRQKPVSINHVLRPYDQSQEAEESMDNFALNIVFLEYIMHHKFYIYLSGMKVTIANSLKCLVIFAITKLMSISINDYLVQKH